MPSIKVTTGDIKSYWTNSKEQLITEYASDLMKWCSEVWIDEETRLIHRENGPAVIAKNGTEYYYRFGKYNRLDGPALCFYFKDRFYWWVNNQELSEGKSEMLTRWWKAKCK